MNNNLLVLIFGFILSLLACLIYLDRLDQVVDGTVPATFNAGDFSKKASSKTDESSSRRSLISRKTDFPTLENAGDRHRVSEKTSRKSSTLQAGTILELNLPQKVLDRVEGLEPAENPKIGKLQAYDSQGFFFVSQVGKMLYVPANVRKVAKPTKLPFVRYNSDRMLEFLQNKFGRNFQILRSRFFVLAVSKKISKKKARNWGRKMDRFYLSLESYFRIRNIPLRKPKNTLVALVFPSKKEMKQYANSVSDKVSNGFVAYYSSLTNRIALYDSPNIHLNQETIFHEAAHQILFNRGFHYRAISAPRWLSEGIATAFEAPGMYDHRKKASRRDRINPYHYRRLLSFLKNPDAEEKIKQLIQSDSLFQTDVDQAYTFAWAMTFYCLETKSRRFSQFIHSTNSQKPFRKPSGIQREKLFINSVGCSPEVFARDLIRFFKNAKNLR